MPSTPFSSWSDLTRVHGQLFILRRVLTLLDVLSEGLHEAPNDCETEAWRELAVLGLHECGDYLRNSITELHALVATHEPWREQL